MREAFLRTRQNLVRLVFDSSLPELETWKGAAKLVGLWLLMTIGFALTPFFVLLRLPFLPGGYRFALVFLPVIALSTLVVLFAIFAVGMAGFGAAH